MRQVGRSLRIEPVLTRGGAAGIPPEAEEPRRCFDGPPPAAPRAEPEPPEEAGLSFAVYYEEEAPDPAGPQEGPHDPWVVDRAWSGDDPDPPHPAAAGPEPEGVPEAPMAAPRPVRRDPAPSRAAYRLHRLWLTPFYRALLRKGVPAFLGVMAVGLALQDEGRRGAIVQWAADLRASITERPEFMVTLVRIDGASDETAAAIRAAMGVALPVSSFDLDLDALQRRVAGIDAVANASLRVRKGGVLDVTVQERHPAVVWRDATGIRTLDPAGHVVAPLLSRLERPDLPLITGEGADRAVPEALHLLAAAGPVSGRVRGLVRVGDRRWDLVVDPSIRVMLPERDPVPALEQVIALHEAQALLDRDIVAVDLRNPARPTVRMGATAAETWRQSAAVFHGVPSR